MKLSTTSIATLLSAGIATAVNSQDVAFLTALVSDFASNKKEYIGYFATAESYPAEITQVALALTTYTDDSYTTLLEGSSIDISSLESYATNLPWYSRIAEEAHFTLSTEKSGSTTTSSKSSATSSAKASASSSTTSNGAGSLLYCSTGAIMGALALVLL